MKKRLLCFFDVFVLLVILVIFIFWWMSVFDRLSSANDNFTSSISIGDQILIHSLFLLILECILILVYVFIGKQKRKYETHLLTYYIFAGWRKHPVIAVTIMLLSVCILFFVFIYYGQNYFVYYPTYSEGSESYLNKDDSFEKVVIENESGEEYVGWLHKPEKESQKTILYFGGNAESSASTLRYFQVDELWDVFGEYNFLMMDYPGYGKSSGKPEEEAILKMSETVFEYVQNNNQLNQKIIVMGFSLGTGVATYIASNYEADGLILLALYDEMKNLYNSRINIFHGPLCSLIRNQYESTKYASNIEEDTIIIASKDDEVIPYQLSENLVKQFLGDVDFMTVSEVGHNDLLMQEGVQKKIREYLQ